MEDIARIAGVSKKTISRYINNSPDVSRSMRARLDAVIAETGFVPNAQARALALRRTFLVALVHDGSDRAVREAAEAGILRAMEGSELALVVLPRGDDAASGLHRFLERHGPTGVVLLPPLADREDLAALCARADTPCLRLGEDEPACDERAAMAALVEWLLANGHRRIGLIAGPDASASARRREAGYHDALAAHGLDRGPWLVAAGDNSFASGMEAAALLLELSPRPTAIVACNDEMAAGALAAAAEKGIAVPGELSVAGFDDTPLAAMTVPPLATVHVPWARMAEAAMARLPGIAPMTRHDRACDSFPGDGFSGDGFPGDGFPEPPRSWQGTPVLRASVAPIAPGQGEPAAMPRLRRAIPQA